MCVCVYVCMCVCVYVCMCVCVYVSGEYVCMCACVHVCMGVCVYVCMCVCVYVCMCVCVYVCMCVCVYVCMCVWYVREREREKEREREIEREREFGCRMAPFNVKSQTLATPLLNSVMLFNTASPLMRSSDSAMALRLCHKTTKDADCSLTLGECTVSEKCVFIKQTLSAALNDAAASSRTSPSTVPSRPVACTQNTTREHVHVWSTRHSATTS